MPAYKDKERGTWYASFYYTDWRGDRKLKKKRGFPRKMQRNPSASVCGKRRRAAI